MKILSIETSCDDTAISIMEAKEDIKKAHQKKIGGQASFKILANASNSQIKIHSPYGGVFPSLAKREHIKNLPILLEKVLKCAKLNFAQKKPVDMIAVTYGPGLEPSLWTGIVFAKELASKWNVPLMPVNHMEGHILSVFGKSKGKFEIPKIDFPVLSLLVSGGHTELVLSKNWLEYKIIGRTLDDAAGEAYDKVARMMNLPYPGGPEISALAETERKKTKLSHEGSIAQRDGASIAIRQQANMRAESGQQFSFNLPRPMMYSKNFDFSFSGLKTAVLYLIRDLQKKDENILENKNIKEAIALEFENAVVETLIYKTFKAKEKYKAKSIIVAGGVALNKHLQREIKRKFKNDTKIYFPEKELTGDNSIMIGIAGYLQFLKKGNKTINPDKIKAEGSLKL